MDQIFGVPTAAFMGQLMLGLVNGSFYAILSLGLAVIFGMLNIVNFAHGALYMTGAFFAWMLLNYAGVNYWFALLLAPIGVPFPGGQFAASADADGWLITGSRHGTYEDHPWIPPLEEFIRAAESPDRPLPARLVASMASLKVTKKSTLSRLVWPPLPTLVPRAGVEAGVRMELLGEAS